MRGEAPSASHKLYTDVLNDDDSEQRRLGIELGYAWINVADLVAFYIDFGISHRMHAGLKDIKSLKFRVHYEIRKVSSDVLNTIRES